MKKIIILLLLVTFVSNLSSQVQDAFKGILPPTNSSIIKSLNGNWNFKLIKGLDWSSFNNFYQVSYDDSQWNKIEVPGNWDMLGFIEPRYGTPDQHTGFYRTEFVVPEEWAKEHVILRFDSVLRGYDLWINGQYVGNWESGFNSCLFDVTPFLKKGKNLLAMRVYSQFRGFEFDCHDDWAPMGISRDVTIFPVPENHLKDWTVQTASISNTDATMNFSFETTSFSKRNKKTSTYLNVSIYSPQGNIISDFQIPATSDNIVRKEVHIANPQLWSAETPDLYKVHFTLYDKKKVLQDFEKRFGIRKISVDGKVLKLNGVALKLRGVAFHATDPLHGKVISEALNLKDMKMLKEANVNYIRTAHYPREPRFYDLCDSLGFYLINEVPFGWGDAYLTDSTYQDILLTRGQATVQRDKNHASVLIWSIGNENPLTPITEVTGQFVQKLDPSRPICYPMIGDYFNKLNYKIPSFVNIYAPHYPTLNDIKHYDETSSRPMVFTEYCHTLGQSLENHHEMWEMIEKSKCIAGGSVWSWVDQGVAFKAKKNDFYTWTDSVWTSREGGFRMSEYKENEGEDGLLYADRTPLPNYYEVQRNYAQAQVTDTCLQLVEGVQTVPIHIRNRYDFINLKDHVTFRWYLTADRDTIQNGQFSPECSPHGENIQNISLDIPAVSTQKIRLLHFNMINGKGWILNHQVIRIEENQLLENRFLASSIQKGNPFEFIQKGPLMRVGRKHTLSEDHSVSKQILKNYLMEAKSKKGGFYIFENDSIRISGKINITPSKNATKVTFDLKPEKSKNLLLETGIAFLLNKSITQVQWVGYGPYASYPGKMSSNNYGFYSMQCRDLYFEGNRMGVDAALLTDTDGNGILLVCKNGKINFEQTDKGLVLTYNVYVSGISPKFSITHYPYYADKIDRITGAFYLYKIDAKDKKTIMDSLFVEPQNIKQPFTPFLSQYDTYLLKYDDIIGK